MGADKCEVLGDTAEEESFEEQKEVEAQVWVWWGSKSTLEGDGCPNDTGEALWKDCVLPGKGASWWAPGGGPAVWGSPSLRLLSQQSPSWSWGSSYRGGPGPL